MSGISTLNVGYVYRVFYPSDTVKTVATTNCMTQVNQPTTELTNQTYHDQCIPK